MKPITVKPINWHFIPDEWHARLLAHLERQPSIWCYRPIRDERGRMIDRELMPIYGPLREGEL